MDQLLAVQAKRAEIVVERTKASPHEHRGRPSAEHREDRCDAVREAAAGRFVEATPAFLFARWGHAGTLCGASARIYSR
jgi:hypothetical protein